MPKMMMSLEKYRVGPDEELLRVSKKYNYTHPVSSLLGKCIVAETVRHGVQYWCKDFDIVPFTFHQILNNSPFVWIDVFMDKYVDKTSRQCSPLGVYARFRVNNMSKT
jgi:hypothetical protein